jgi:hypothetical protein
LTANSRKRSLSLRATYSPHLIFPSPDLSEAFFNLGQIFRGEVFFGDLLVEAIHDSGEQFGMRALAHGFDLGNQVV